MPLPYVDHGGPGPLVVCLHWLGGNATTWTRVAEGLTARGHRCVAIDLPGFGRARDVPGYTVAEMRDAVVATIAEIRGASSAWGLVGHSMGAKVASAVARLAADAPEGSPLAGLRMLVAISGSPPWPEPMSEDDRARLVRELGHASEDPLPDRRKDQMYAEAFVRANVGDPALPDDEVTAAANELLGMNRAAWTAWFLRGANEDWSARVGELSVAALLLYGEKEKWLGKNVQMDFARRHVPGAELAMLTGAAHLGPLERVSEVVDRIAVFAAPRLCSVVSPSFAALLASSRVTDATRAALLARTNVQAVNSASERAPWSEGELRILRGLVARIVPGAPPDVAVRVQASLDEAVGDGWRFASEPPDAEAWHRGLARLAGAGFATASAAAQDAAIARDESRWMEDARALVVQMYMSDPRTMDRTGFRGFADEPGFTQIRLGQRETFES